MHRAKRTMFMAAALLLAAAALGAEGSGESYLPYLFAAFAIAWGAFFVYAFFLTRKQADLQRDIDALRQSRGDDDDA